MLFWRKLGLSDAAASVVLILALVISGGGWLMYKDAETEQETAGPQAVLSEDVTSEQDAPATDESEQAVVAPETLEADVEPAKPELSAPKLDLVRVSPDGGAVIAGTADPDTQVVFLVNGEELARVISDRGGSFVGLFDIPPSGTPNAITVAAEGADGELFSDENILISAIEAPEVATGAEVSAETELDVAAAEQARVDPEQEDVSASGAEPVVESTPATIVATPEPEIAVIVETPDDLPVETLIAEDEPKVDEVIAQVEPQVTAVEPVPNDTTPSDTTPVVVQDDVASLSSNVGGTVLSTDSEPQIAADPELPTRLAPAIVVTNSAGVKLVQPAARPQAPSPVVADNVVIDTITYDDEGEVALLGRGEGEGFVRVYLNDKPVLTVPVDPDGSWNAPLADVDAGVYRLRVDELTSQGVVTSRVETPFQREEVELAATARPTAVTVQPGSTLWAIAKNQLGEGVEYVRVYEANRDLIRNPNLIYPGQVFAIPTE